MFVIFAVLATIIVISVILFFDNKDTAKNTPPGSTPRNTPGSTPSKYFNLLEWETAQTDLVPDTDYVLTENGFQPLGQGTKTLTVDESKFPMGAFKLTLDWRDTLVNGASHKCQIGTGTGRATAGGFVFGKEAHKLTCWVYNSNNDQVKFIPVTSAYYSDDVSIRSQGYREVLMWDGVDTITIEHYEGGDYATPNKIHTYTFTPEELNMNPFSYTEKNNFFIDINSQVNDGGSPPITIESDGIVISTLKIEEL